MISLDASQSISSYQAHGHGSGTPGSKLRYSTPTTEITIDLVLESNHFYADVITHSRHKSGEAGEKKQQIDLTNLRPTSIDLGADNEGRSYQLNLTPNVVSTRLSPKPFQEAANDLYQLRFHASRIMLNDKRYIGRMLTSDADFFSIEVCGLASLEFSLHHLKGAEAWGKLQNGQITLNNPDGTSIEIGNVTNGMDDHLVDGGPYIVWVRWKTPTQTVEEYRTAMAEYREKVRSGAAGTGPATSVNEALAVIDQELANRARGSRRAVRATCQKEKSSMMSSDPYFG